MNDRDSEELQLVVFTVGGHEFGIPISVVREINVLSEPTALPNMPPSMVGIINVRGSIIAIVDLAKRFAMENHLSVESTNQRVLLVEIDGSMVGYLVDSVSEVLQVPANSVEGVGKILGVNQYIVHSICRIEDRLIPIVDSTRIMTSNEVQQLGKFTEERMGCSEI